jgi:RNA polymerase sigma factor (sigma-70 family)
VKPHSKSDMRPDLTQYLNLVERVAKAEYRRVPSHMIDYEELVSIGAIAVQNILRGKTQEQMEKLNISYMATATRWAIRNELRTRFKWYTLKHKAEDESLTEEQSVTDENGLTTKTPGHPNTEQIREAVYESILSIDSMQSSEDGDASYDFISDSAARPDESLEIVELGKAIKRAIENLPPKERTIVEYRFYRNMQVKDIAMLVGLSSSRVTRIVQSSLDLVREQLKEMEQF